MEWLKEREGEKGVSNGLVGRKGGVLHTKVEEQKGRKQSVGLSGKKRPAAMEVAAKLGIQLIDQFVCCCRRKRRWKERNREMLMGSGVEGRREICCMERRCQVTSSVGWFVSQQLYQPQHSPMSDSTSYCTKEFFFFDNSRITFAFASSRPCFFIRGRVTELVSYILSFILIACNLTA